MRYISLAVIALLLAGPVAAATLVHIPLDQQIDIGLGNAITEHTGFAADGGVGFVRRALTVGSGAGEWYSGPRVDLVKAGYGPYVDMSAPGTTIQYTARYFQGGGNTNPYGDAPIFVSLTDVDGNGLELGVSYGAQPNPTYPAWITCTDSIDDLPPGSPFDASKVVAISFYGTDWAGTGDDYVDIRDLRIADTTVHDTIPIAEAKSRAEGVTVEVEGIVSAVIGSASRFYVQSVNRCCGIQVRCGTQPSVGSSVFVTGEVRTDTATGEMYIDASGWSRNGLGIAKPLLMNSRSLGGGTLARQEGVFGGAGLNNIGLLVRCYGEVADFEGDRSYAYLTDGLRVDLTGVPYWQRPAISVGQKTVVTGVSSMYVGDEGEKHPCVVVASASGFANLESDGNEPKTLRVLVVNFDPFCPGYGDRRTHEVFGWGNPHDLTDGYVSDLATSSGNWCQYEVVDWFDADYHPYFEDGFQYAPDDYVYAWTNHPKDMHPGTADYVRLVTDKSYPHNQPLSIAERIAGDEIDEVFFFGAPAGFAGWEAAMAGPSPFFINGGTYNVPEAGRNFAMMGFNYERGVDCMLEDFCHRTECVMSRVYQPADWWFPTYPVTNNWDRFRMFDDIETGNAACGICHFAPNSESDYDWGNTRYVLSTCDDWLYNWPNLLGDITARLVSCDEWGGGDMRLHHAWWLNHLPKAAGINPDGKQNNWWKYTCDFSSYPESR